MGHLPFKDRLAPIPFGPLSVVHLGMRVAEIVERQQARAPKVIGAQVVDEGHQPIVSATATCEPQLQGARMAHTADELGPVDITEQTEFANICICRDDARSTASMCEARLLAFRARRTFSETHKGADGDRHQARNAENCDRYLPSGPSRISPPELGRATRQALATVLRQAPRAGDRTGDRADRKAGHHNDGEPQRARQQRAQTPSGRCA